MGTGGITKRSVDALAGGTGDVFLWDDELRGFGVKVTPSGAKSYVYSYRLGGREASKRRYTIGKHGSPWTPSTARDRANKLALMVAQGIDPMQAERERRDEAATLNFDVYAERFIRDYLMPEWPRSWDGYAPILRKRAKLAFAGKTIKTITRGDVAALLATMSSSPATRRKAFAVLRRMFKWAVGQDDLELSPIRDVEPPPAVATRDRILTDGELASIWNAADALGYPFGPMFQLLIATGQRREEVAALDWRELDQRSATWTLPATRAKNRQTHLVPLSATAMGVVDQIVRTQTGCAIGPIRWPAGGFVLTTTGRSGVSGYSKGKARLDTAIAEAGAPPIEPWRIHDLRRTLATGLQRLGVRFEVTEAVLNHTSGAKSGVAGIYQRHDWKEEKRAALQDWGRHLRNAATSGSHV